MLKKINRFRAQDFLNKNPEISKRTDFFTVKGFRSDKNNRFSVVLSKKNINRKKEEHEKDNAFFANSKFCNCNG